MKSLSLSLSLSLSFSLSLLHTHTHTHTQRNSNRCNLFVRGGFLFSVPAHGDFGCGGETSDLQASGFHLLLGMCKTIASGLMQALCAKVVRTDLTGLPLVSTGREIVFCPPYCGPHCLLALSDNLPGPHQTQKQPRMFLSTRKNDAGKQFSCAILSFYKTKQNALIVPVWCTSPNMFSVSHLRSRPVTVCWRPKVHGQSSAEENPSRLGFKKPDLH